MNVAAIDRFIRRELGAASIPGAAVAITRMDQIVHVRGYGRDSSDAAVTERTLFRVASLSKSFTSLAVMQLVEAGLLTLDDKVASHLPEFRPTDPRGADITVRQLLDQTSGLADRQVPDVSRRQPTNLTEAITSLNSARLVAAPGTQWNYHNPNYHVAARIVEVISGERFDEYLHRHIFKAAQMASSSTTVFHDDPVTGLAEGHVLAYGRRFAMGPPHIFGVGSGGVITSASDMARWLIIHGNAGRTAHGRRLISEDGLRQMHSASAPGGYALGWDSDGPAGAPTSIEHSGNLLTFSAYQAVLLDAGYGVALLFNSSSGLMREQTTIFDGVLGIVRGSNRSPTGPGVRASMLDFGLALLTAAVLVLGIIGVWRSVRWGRRHSPPRLRTTLRLVPQVGVIGLAACFARIVAFGLGRDVTWQVAAYGWPALVIFVFAGSIAASATMIARTWSLLRLSRLSRRAINRG